MAADLKVYEYEVMPHASKGPLMPAGRDCGQKPRTLLLPVFPSWMALCISQGV